MKHNKELSITIGGKQKGDELETAADHVARVC